MNILIRKVSLGYIRLFPELLDRFYSNGDRTIVKLILDKVSENNEVKGVINMNVLEKDVEEVLNTMKNES